MQWTSNDRHSSSLSWPIQNQLRNCTMLSGKFDMWDPITHSSRYLKSPKSKTCLLDLEGDPNVWKLTSRPKDALQLHTPPFPLPWEIVLAESVLQICMLAFRHFDVTRIWNSLEWSRSSAEKLIYTWDIPCELLCLKVFWGTSKVDLVSTSVWPPAPPKVRIDQFFPPKRPLLGLFLEVNFPGQKFDFCYSMSYIFWRLCNVCKGSNGLF